MESFLGNIEQLRNHYLNLIPNTEVENVEISKMDSVITGIRGLQYLAYYLYRIWFKYLPVMLSANESLINSRSRVMDPVISKLDISGSARRLILAGTQPFPLAGRMPNDPTVLNELIKELSTQLGATYQHQSLLDPAVRHKLYTPMMDFIKRKEKMEIVVEDITRLKLLLPGLSKSNNE